MIMYNWTDDRKIEVVDIRVPDYSEQEFVQGLSHDELIRERMTHAEEPSKIDAIEYECKEDNNNADDN